ncbi:MAG TPA: DUF4157 domain-containing protein, partial [Daejeonella sp.]
MSYKLKNSEKSPAKSNSAGETIALRKGISAPSVPAFQMKKHVTQLAAVEEEPVQGKFEAVQRAGMEEEEPLQGKFDTVQRAGMEEEEPLQGKFEVAQRAAMEEEEPLQGKFETVQRAGMEEEEPLQGRFDIAQRAAMDEEEPLQGKFETLQRAGIEEEEPLQGKFLKNATAFNLPVQKKDDGGSSGTTGLPSHLKSGVESLSGFSMDDVKVHYNSDKPKQLKAHAYAQGTDIHIAPGQEQHLPHEAWHVAQQKQGRVQATVQMKGNVPVNDDTGLETEADVMGAKADQAGKQAMQLQKKKHNSFNGNT